MSNKLPEALHQQRLTLYNQGLSDNEIAKRLNLSSGPAIYYWRKINNLPAHPSKFSNRAPELTDQQKAWIRENYYKLTLTEIAQYLDIPETTFKKLLYSKLIKELNLELKCPKQRRTVSRAGLMELMKKAVS
jgi:transposase